MHKNYWGYRIDTNEIAFFWRELKEGRLRQGWGYDTKQDLRKLELDEGARKNLPMFDNVKKGDVILIPQLPQWGKIALFEATEDWNQGYRFEVAENMGDYGHIFPAKYLQSITHANVVTRPNLHAALKNPARFWNLQRCKNDIAVLIKATWWQVIYQKIRMKLKLNRSSKINSRFN